MIQRAVDSLRSWTIGEPPPVRKEEAAQPARKAQDPELAAKILQTKQYKLSNKKGELESIKRKIDKADEREDDAKLRLLIPERNRVARELKELEVEVRNAEVIQKAVEKAHSYKATKDAMEGSAAVMAELNSELKPDEIERTMDRVRAGIDNTNEIGALFSEPLYDPTDMEMNPDTGHDIDDEITLMQRARAERQAVKTGGGGGGGHHREKVPAARPETERMYAELTGEEEDEATKLRRQRLQKLKE